MSQAPGSGSAGPPYYSPNPRLRYSYDSNQDESVYESGRSSQHLQYISFEGQPVERTIPRTVAQPPYPYGTPPSYPSPNTTPSYPYSPNYSNYAVPGPSNAPFGYLSPPHTNLPAGPSYMTGPPLPTISNVTRDFERSSFGSPPQNHLRHVKAIRVRPSTQGSVHQLYTTPGTISVDPSNEPVGENKLNSKFRKRKQPKKFFVVGKVFLTLWCEPAGNPDSNGGSTYTAMTSNDSGISHGRFGETIHSKIRRFIVVRQGHESCTCLPILTYDGKGVARRGVRKSDHAIIHTTKQPPVATEDERPARGERGMMTRAVRIDVDVRTDKLDEMSRVNFGKVYTIEHNVKVHSLGKVNRDSRVALLVQWKTIWADTVGITSLQSIFEGQQTEAALTVDEWRSALRALMNNGFTEDRARAILQSPSRTRPVNESEEGEEEEEENEENRDGSGDA